MTSIVILASGSSSRMGRPKQNLIFNGKTLLQRIIFTAKLVTEDILVILGAASNELLPTLENLNVTTLINPDWSDGMATSITIFVEHLLSSNSESDGVIFLVCDQPYIDAHLLSEMIKQAELSKRGIIACSYNNTIGVPAYFKKIYYPELLKLKGREGAKKLIEQYPDDVQAIPFPLGAIDIDTEDDYNKLLSGK